MPATGAAIRATILIKPIINIRLSRGIAEGKRSRNSIGYKKMKEAVKRKIATEESNSNLQHIFNNFLAINLTSLIIGEQPSPVEEIEEGSIIKTLGTVEGITKAIRLMKRKNRIPQRRMHPLLTISDINISSLTFCRPVKYSLKDEMVFWMMRNKTKKKLKLDNPKAVLVLPNDYFIAIERKYINLYLIEDKLQLTLKDFDSQGIGKKFTFVELKHILYKNKHYVIIFGNEKEQAKVFFSGLVYEVSGGKLKFIKKNPIAEKEVISPTIIFESYPNEKDEKFCLVVGGSERIDNYYYSGLKIDLHLFMNQFLNYSPLSTDEIPFSNRNNIIMSGKAIYFKENWYLFCSEEQTINELILIYGGPGKSLTRLEIRSEKLNLKESLYFTEDSLHYLYEGEQDKIVFVNKKMAPSQRTLEGIVYKLVP